MFFKVINKKGVLKGSLAYMQHFKFVNWRIGELENWRIRFLMSRTGYKSNFSRNVCQLIGG